MNVPNIHAPNPCVTVSSFDHDKDDFFTPGHDSSSSNVKDMDDEMGLSKSVSVIGTCSQLEIDFLGPVVHDLIDNDTHLGNYALGCYIGHGSFGEVFEVFDNKMTDNKVNRYAVKRLEKARFQNDPDAMQEVEHELKVLRRVDHPNLIKLREIIHAPKFVYVVMEKGAVDLASYVHENWLDEKSLCEIAFGILKPLEYLHSIRICHMDVKPDNIMVMKHVAVNELEREHIKLCDFGLSTIAESTGEPEIWQQGTKGTPGFYAPEMVAFGLDHEYDAVKADMWSFACTILDLLGDIPDEWFDAYSRYTSGDQTRFYKDLKQLVKETHKEFLLYDNPSLEMIVACLRMDPNRRQSASQCIFQLERSLGARNSSF